MKNTKEVMEMDKEKLIKIVEQKFKVPAEDVLAVLKPEDFVRINRSITPTREFYEKVLHFFKVIKFTTRIVENLSNMEGREFVVEARLEVLEDEQVKEFVSYGACSPNEVSKQDSLHNILSKAETRARKRVVELFLTQAVIEALAKLILDQDKEVKEISLQEIEKEFEPSEDQKPVGYVYLTYNEILNATHLDRNTFRERFRKAREILGDEITVITQGDRKVYKMTKQTLNKLLELIMEENNHENDIEF